MSESAAELRERLVRGVALFNSGQFLQAHEAWEDAWREEEGDTRVCLQGLIQIAAGYFKATVQDQPRGCVKLLTSGLEKVSAVPADLLGVATAELVPHVQRTLAEAQRWLDGAGPRPELAALPKIRLL